MWQEEGLSLVAGKRLVKLNGCRVAQIGLGLRSPLSPSQSVAGFQVVGSGGGWSVVGLAVSKAFLILTFVPRKRITKMQGKGVEKQRGVDCLGRLVGGRSNHLALRGVIATTNYFVLTVTDDYGLDYLSL